MNVHYTARQAALTPEIRAYCEKRLARLKSLVDDVLDVNVILIVQKSRNKAEINVRAKGGGLRRRRGDPGHDGFPERAFDTLEKRIRKERAKWREKKRRGGRERKALAPAVEAAGAGEAGRPERLLTRSSPCRSRRPWSSWTSRTRRSSSSGARAPRAGPPLPSQGRPLRTGRARMRAGGDAVTLHALLDEDLVLPRLDARDRAGVLRELAGPAGGPARRRARRDAPRQAPEAGGARHDGHRPRRGRAPLPGQGAPDAGPGARPVARRRRLRGRRREALARVLPARLAGGLAGRGSPPSGGHRRPDADLADPGLQAPQGADPRRCPQDPEGRGGEGPWFVDRPPPLRPTRPSSRRPSRPGSSRSSAWARSSSATAASARARAPLELIARGHQFVADDVVQIRVTPGGELWGSAPALSRNFMEIRGLGIINIRAIFGPRSIAKQARVDLVVRLKKWRRGYEVDRLGLKSGDDMLVLGRKVPQLAIPVAPGRNIATLIEIACKVHILRQKGYSAPDEIIRRLDRVLT